MVKERSKTRVRFWVELYSPRADVWNRGPIAFDTATKARLSFRFSTIRYDAKRIIKETIVTEVMVR